MTYLWNGGTKCGPLGHYIVLSIGPFLGIPFARSYFPRARRRGRAAPIHLTKCFGSQSVPCSLGGIHNWGVSWPHERTEYPARDQQTRHRTPV